MTGVLNILAICQLPQRSILAGRPPFLIQLLQALGMKIAHIRADTMCWYICTGVYQNFHVSAHKWKFWWWFLYFKKSINTMLFKPQLNLQFIGVTNLVTCARYEWQLPSVIDVIIMRSMLGPGLVRGGPLCTLFPYAHCTHTHCMVYRNGYKMSAVTSLIWFLHSYSCNCYAWSDLIFRILMNTLTTGLPVNK